MLRDRAFLSSRHTSSAVFLIALLCVVTLPAGNAQTAGSIYQPNATAAAIKQAESLKLQAEHGSAQAQYELGRAYIEGHVLRQNFPEAVKWTKAAAAQGMVKAEVNLAVMYQQGRWLPQDYAQSLLWNHKAADQGDPNAEYNLGVMYAYGQGVPRDLAQGMQWYLKAGEQGHQMAAYNVGVGYSEGIGLPADRVKGYTWQLLACHFGFGHCKETLRYLDQKLPPAQREVARKKADDWMRAHPNIKGIAMGGP